MISIEPLLIFVAMLRPYWKGFTLSLASSAASDEPTLMPSLITVVSLMISIEPLLILVAMLRAWKKEVCAGSRPVAPLGIVQLQGAITPALAAAGLTYSLITSSMSVSSPWVKTKPMLPTMYGTMDSHAGWVPSAHRFRMHRRIIVFLPKTSSALPRRAMRMSEICLEPTKSAWTMKARGYLLRHSSRWAKYATFFERATISLAQAGAAGRPGGQIPCGSGK